MRQKLFSFERVFMLNWPAICLMTLLACIGFAMLYSAAEGSFSPWAYRQMLRFALLFPVMLVIAVVDIRFWFKSAYVIYFLVLLALVLTEFFGVTAMGATRWLRLGPFNIQPSEIAKVSVVFALAHYFHTVSSANVGKILYLIPPLLMVAVPSLLIMKQPDLGTALILLMVAGAMFFVSGVKLWKFGAVIFVGVVSLPFVISHLHDYQKKRVLAFLSPESDPMGHGYNILQSKIAIGSGGLFGKGFLKGTQSQLSFLPEKQTDFIFTMLTEEFGFVGGVVILCLYAMLIIYGLYVAVNSKSHFGRLMAVGVTSIFFFHIFVNVAMVMGLIPIVGAPLPLISYGGTIMVTILVAFGLLLNANLYEEASFGKDID